MTIPAPNRPELLTLIAEAGLHRQLGLFIGAGFSKGVLKYHHPIPAYDWPELLQVICKDFSLNYDDYARPGTSYPDIASSICEAYGRAQTPPLALDEAQLRFKEAAARHTTWYPSKEQRTHFGPILSHLNPTWMITTNYDLVIESLLVGRSISVGPSKALPSGGDLIPVYHLHGMKYDPQSLVITREDYVSLFRPNEYRQAKLATAIKESTTVFLGYALGDINVLTAIDWSRNVYTDTAPVRPTEFILVLFSPHPAAQPYRNEHGILVVEMNDLSSFMTEIDDAWMGAQKAYADRRAKLEAISKELDASPSAMVEKFVDDPAYRAQLLSILKTFEVELISSFMTFFAACLDATWERALPSGAFHAYDQQLTIILDLMVTFSFVNIPPALFELLATSLEKLGSYIGRGSGQSWQANDTWISRKGSIPKDMVKELRQLADQRWLTYTANLLQGL